MLRTMRRMFNSKQRIIQDQPRICRRSEECSMR
jgi:hypothetical protein